MITMRRISFLIPIAVLFILVLTIVLIFRSRIKSEEPYRGVSTYTYPPYGTDNSSHNTFDLHVASVCQGTDCLKSFGNMQSSLNRRGFKLHRIEIQGSFSWINLALAYADFAQSRIPLDSLVVFIDASDVLAQGCAVELVNRYERLVRLQHKSILLGVESHCSNPRKCHKLQNIHPPIKRIRSNELHYINGGFVMGTVAACEAAWREIARRFEDTQLGWGQYADEHPDIVALDWNQEVVASNTAEEWTRSFQVVPGIGVEHIEKLNNGTVASPQPIFLHALCHTCSDSHPTGKGGPKAFKVLSDLIRSANVSCMT